MKKILLVCNAGMSTSMLAKKMQAYSDTEKLGFEVTALPVEQGRQLMDTSDVVLVGPQVKFLLKELQEAFPTIPMAVVPMQAYGLMDGKSVIELVEQLLIK